MDEFNVRVISGFLIILAISISPVHGHITTPYSLFADVKTGACNISEVSVDCRDDTATTDSPLVAPNSSTETLISNAPTLPVFTYYKLVLSWPRAVCNVKENPCDGLWTTELPGDKFTIHGLWPEVGNQSRKPTAPFDTTKIRLNLKLKKELLTFWPNAKFKLAQGSMTREKQKEERAFDFWTHEWNEHGVFSGLDSFSYLQTTLQLYHKVGNLYSVLAENQMTHGVGQKIDIAKAFKVIHEKLGVRPYLKCNYDPQGNQQLVEIDVWFSKQTLDMVDSMGTPDTNCTVSSVGFI